MFEIRQDFSYPIELVKSLWGTEPYGEQTPKLLDFLFLMIKVSITPWIWVLRGGATNSYLPIIGVDPIHFEVGITQMYVRSWRKSLGHSLK